MGDRILLADDSLTIQKVVELTFSGAEWELRTAGSGDRAVGLLPDFSPDLVLADAVMPGLTGYEVCEAVKRLPDGQWIPVVMLTGTFEPFDRARADRAGADAVVTKPFDSHALAGMVRDLIARAREAKAAAPPLPPPPAPEPLSPPLPEPEPLFEVAGGEAGEDTGPTGPGAVPYSEPPAAGPAADPVPDSMYATTAIPIFTPEQVESFRPPLPPEPPPPVEQAIPVPPPAAEGYEMDMGGLDEEAPPRGDIEADIAAFERTARIPSAEMRRYAERQAASEADAESVEIPPAGAPLDIPEPTGELEALAKQASLNDLSRMVGASAGPAPLTEDDVDRIAHRVVELLGESVVRKVAWDVVPEMAERLVRERLAELERAD
jgi:CheY-like chemotaxis protein